jgi:cadmium resistance protein CadD (predicted permease)
MWESLSGAGTAILVFAVTDIDDLVLLAAFFGDKHLRPRAVVMGQFAGIALLTAASALAAWAAIAIPPGWISLLGLLPLGLGLFKLRGPWRHRTVDGTDEAAEAMQSERRLEGKLRSQVLGVAAVTVANGADNLSVYIPLFAAHFAALPLFVAVFAVMTAIWCVLGYALVRNPAGAAVMNCWGHILLPVVLIALGLHILSGAAVLL